MPRKPRPQIPDAVKALLVAQPGETGCGGQAGVKPPAPLTGLLGEVQRAVVGLSVALDHVEEDLGSPQVSRDKKVLWDALRDLAMCQLVLRRAAARMGMPITPPEPSAAECAAAGRGAEGRPAADDWRWMPHDDEDE